MFTPTTQQAQIRYRRIPARLKDLIFDEKETEIVYMIAQEIGLSKDQTNTLVDTVLWVFLGFVSLDDLGGRLAETLKLDRGIAEKLAGKLYDRIFAFVKTEIKENYKPEFTEDEAKEPTETEISATNTQEPNNETVFSLESLAPINTQIATTKHPEATIAQKPNNQEIPLPEPVILHSESEIAPIGFEGTLKSNAEIPAPSKEDTGGKAKVEFAEFDIDAQLKELEKSLLGEPIKNQESSSAHLQEFVPQTRIGIEEDKKTISTTPVTTPTEFADLSALAATQDSLQEQVKNTETRTLPTLPDQTTPKTSSFTVNLKGEDSTIIKNEPEKTTKQEQQAPEEIQTATNTQPEQSTGVLGKLSRMFGGLGEKPAPVRNRQFGPKETNAKIVDYTGMPKPETDSQPLTTQQITNEVSNESVVVVENKPKEEKAPITQPQESMVVNLKEKFPVPPPTPPYK